MYTPFRGKYVNEYRFEFDCYNIAHTNVCYKHLSHKRKQDLSTSLKWRNSTLDILRPSSIFIIILFLDLINKNEQKFWFGERFSRIIVYNSEFGSIYFNLENLHWNMDLRIKLTL